MYVWLIFGTFTLHMHCISIYTVCLMNGILIDRTYLNILSIRQSIHLHIVDNMLFSINNNRREGRCPRMTLTSVADLRNGSNREVEDGSNSHVFKHTFCNNWSHIHSRHHSRSQHVPFFPSSCTMLLPLSRNSIATHFMFSLSILYFDTVLRSIWRGWLNLGRIKTSQDVK